MSLLESERTALVEFQDQIWRQLPEVIRTLERRVTEYLVNNPWLPPNAQELHLHSSQPLSGRSVLVPLQTALTVRVSFNSYSAVATAARAMKHNNNLITEELLQQLPVCKVGRLRVKPGHAIVLSDALVYGWDAGKQNEACPCLHWRSQLPGDGPIPIDSHALAILLDFDNQAEADKMVDLLDVNGIAV